MLWRIGDFGAGRIMCQASAIRVVGEVDTIIVCGLVSRNVGLGEEVFGVVGVDVEVIWFEPKDDGNMRRLAQIPELEAAKFVNDNVVRLNIIQNV